jgi:uncharacterized protein
MNIPENAALQSPHATTARAIGLDEPQVIRLTRDTAPLATALDGRSLLVLHLLPAVLIGAAFVLLARALEPSGAPANLALLLAMLVVTLPVELGYVLWHRQPGNGASTLMMPIAGAKALPRRQAVLLIALLFIWSLLGYTLLAPVATWLHQTLFGWWPAWLQLDGLVVNLSALDPAIVWTMVGLSLALNVVVPWAEELYFRGYLVPRMGALGRWAPLVNTALFSLYHVWLPWEFFSRVVALLPAIYVVWWKRDLRVSIWVHVLLNSTGSIGLLALALNAQR